MTPTAPSPVILLAGVPGAGKTETLKEVRRRAPWLRVSDPETVRDGLRRLAPWLPYTLGRPIVHTIAHVLALFRILRRGGPPLIVHDPGTRRWSRRLFLRLARLSRRPAIGVFIDVDRDVALRGQKKRSRIVRGPAFARHWRRWLGLRSHLIADEEPTPGERWPQIVLTTRDRAVDDLLALVSR
ncbi:AAA family ATPase [Brevibacterium sp. XM4083]|uniref:AAA family ATPase n=1 Tax=Brevibacterium sp. XM4083 TaxID=2583238 RepID=UPI001126E912|nr:AAA family ATPase [Brevibacterium sp. XM4083]MCM1011097.1 ATP-binding protein [Brevibacterium sp. XM4083]